MPLKLFEAHGVEIEYMIVDAATLDVLPAADWLIRSAAGADQFVGDVAFGPITWSNELVLHVVELKCSAPAANLAGLAAEFHRNVARANERLAGLGGRLLPGGMHPWMDPTTQTVLWPHEYNVVYQNFDRIFGCRGHGWSNLQSAHLNLPFRGDEEFARLHAAVRIVLPLLPALAASSPFVDGSLGPALDNRLAAYRTNCARVPRVAGRVIPEPAFSRSAYEDEILLPLYRDIAPHDPDGVLQDEWLNARGAIARFERGSIEVRLLDAQERPAADVAIIALLSAVTRELTRERWSSLARQQAATVDALEPILRATVRDAERAAIADGSVLELLGIRDCPLSAGEVWRRLREQLDAPLRALAPETLPALDLVLEHGSLATRLVRAVGPRPNRQRLRDVYARLADCLRDDQAFMPNFDG